MLSAALRFEGSAEVSTAVNGFKPQHCSRHCKSTSAYINSIGGEFCRSKISEDDRKAGMGKEASNSISESNHACSTALQMHLRLVELYTIHLDYMATHAQTTTNHDWEKNRSNHRERHFS